MRDDLISRQAAIKTLEKGLPSEPLKSKYTEGITVGFGLAITWIEQLPSAQQDCSDCIKHGGDWDCDHVHCHKGESAQSERKKGKWIETDDGWDGTYYVCSECGCPWTLIDGTPEDNGMNYCPNCGADMRGGNDE